MLSRVLAGTGRYRRVVLGGAWALAAAVLVAGYAVPFDRGRPLLGAAVEFVVVPVGMLGSLTLLRRRPAVLMVNERAGTFESPAHPGPVLQTAAAILAIGAVALFLPTGPLLVDGVLAGFAAVTVALAIAATVLVWRGSGVRLRPDALLDRSPLGTLTVPWEALADGFPWADGKANVLVLGYARPELVRQRWSRAWSAKVTPSTVDTGFLASAVRYYVAHPERRGGIGTEAGYRELVSEAGRTTVPR